MTMLCAKASPERLCAIDVKSKRQDHVDGSSTSQIRATKRLTEAFPLDPKLRTEIVSA